MRKYTTDEERVARKLSDLMADLRLDLEWVAIHLHNISSRVSVSRILLMAEVLKEEREEKENHNDYI